MTEAQRQWLRDNPEYTPVGSPRLGVKFWKFGTLYADGSFTLGAPLQTIVLEPGCIGVGVPESQR